MAGTSYLFDKGKAGLLDGSIDLSADTIRVMLCDSSFAETLTDTSMTTPGADRIGADVTLSGKTENVVADGVFDDTGAPNWSSVAGGSTIGGLILFKYVTNDAGSTPIAFIHVADQATNGGDIDVTWNASGIFSL